MKKLYILFAVLLLAVPFLYAEEDTYSIEKNEANTSFTEEFEDNLDYLLKFSYYRKKISSLQYKLFPKKIFLDNTTGMIFYPNSLYSRDINVENIDETLKIIQDYNDFFNSKGVDFIFMSIPDKETIHSQELPPELKEYQNYTGYLNRLYAELDNRQIKTIKLYGPLTEAKEVFQLDDTHWNGGGVQIAVKETIIFIENLTKIEESR
jgi:hypothetical protein